MKNLHYVCTRMNGKFSFSLLVVEIKQVDFFFLLASTKINYYNFVKVE